MAIATTEMTASHKGDRSPDCAGPRSVVSACVSQKAIAKGIVTVNAKTALNSTHGLHHSPQCVDLPNASSRVAGKKARIAARMQNKPKMSVARLKCNAVQLRTTCAAAARISPPPFGV